MVCIRQRRGCVDSEDGQFSYQGLGRVHGVPNHHTPCAIPTGVISSQISESAQIEGINSAATMQMLMMVTMLRRREEGVHISMN